MSEPVKRQKVCWDDGGETIKRFHELDAVLATDHDRVAQERDTLRVGVERLRELLRSCIEHVCATRYADNDEGDYHDSRRRRLLKQIAAALSGSKEVE